MDREVLTEVTSLSGATTGTGIAPDFTGLCRLVTAHIVWSTGVTAGAVQLEAAETTTYAGTWSTLGTPVSPKVADSVDIVVAEGMYKAVRARVTTTVVGGTVTVKLSARG